MQFTGSSEVILESLWIDQDPGVPQSIRSGWQWSCKMFSILTVTITIDLSRPVGAEDSRIWVEHLSVTETQSPGVSGQFLSAKSTYAYKWPYNPSKFTHMTKSHRNTIIKNALSYRPNRPLSQSCTPSCAKQAFWWSTSPRRVLNVWSLLI